jgi:flagellar FliL protein
MAAQPEPPKPAAKTKAADPKAPAAPKAPADPKAAVKTEKPPRKSGKLLLLVGFFVLLAAGGAGGYVLLSGNEPAENAETAEAPEQPSVFVPLETFTVNLLPADGLHQYLQTTVTLKVANQTTADAVKTRMPEVRNRILMILSSKRPAELMPIAGKQKLATEIGEAVHGMVARPKPADAAAAKAAPAPAAESAGANGNGSRARPVEVLFTAFIIQ